MKKMIASALGLSFVVGLAGCGGGGSTSASASKSSSTSSNPSSLKSAAKKLFPDGLTILVGFGAGGTVDTGARLIAPGLSKVLGVPVVVQNKPGGGGDTAAQYEYRQKSSAPKLLMTFLPAFTLGQILGHGKYQVKQMTPVYGIYGKNTIVLIAKKGSKYKNFNSLKNATQTITAATAGVRTSAAWMSLAFLSGVNHIHIKAIPYKGGAAGTDAALGGSVDVAATTLVEATRLIHSGKAQGIVEFGSQTYPSMPGVESIAKVGKPSEVFYSQMGLTGPPKMPQNELNVLSKALKKATADPSFIKKAKNTGLDVVPESQSAWKATLNKSYSTIEKDKSFLNTF